MLIDKKVSYSFSEDKLLIKKKYANKPYVANVKQMKDMGIDGFGENKLVGRIPMHLMADWIKEAGLEWSDTEAVRDMMRKKLLSGDFDKIRPWEGTF